jgi:hypothetical protein
VSRLQGFVRLYAAVLQVDRDPRRMEAALGHAWAYVAWLLNALPASRYTASALDAFLSVAAMEIGRKIRPAVCQDDGLCFDPLPQGIGRHWRL